MKKILFLLFLLNCSLALRAQSSSLKVEPANWWVDMQHHEIQLLVYGKNIGQCQAQISHPSVSLTKSVTVPNPDYLFLYLEINEATRAGTVPIQFYEQEKKLHTYDFVLHERAADRAEIEGFNTSDVMYLITPDRFANGDPTNDNIEGMKEKANRQFKGGRHGGDLKGITDHLDYIADLGFTAIWLNPVIENDMPKYSYHGYAATDFYQIDRRIGTNEAYRDFCQIAKQKGIKIIMDMILNHAGSEHWFVRNPPTPDWINLGGEFQGTNHRRQTIQDIHASEYDKKAFSDGWFVVTMPDLNQRNELLADYLIQNTIWWIEYAGISGIRMDTYPYPDKEFMNRWTCAVMQEYPNFNIVGEEWSTNAAIVAYWQKGKNNPDAYTSCLPSVMDFPLQDAVVKALREGEKIYGQGLAKAYEALAMDFLYADPNQLVIFPDNHDMDRIITQLNNDFELFKMAMVYFATMRGVPQFYYGTEILMNSNTLPGDHGLIRSDFPGGWSGDTVNAFTGKGLTPLQREAQSFTKKLLNWRKKNTVIHHGKLIQFAPENGVYSYVRIQDNKQVMVVFNKNEKELYLPLLKYAELFDGQSKAFSVLENKAVSLAKGIRVEAKSALILEIE
ncbi:MAG: glycoside hydrolase family 13 protein [Saprospiraceae bacterium]